MREPLKRALVIGRAEGVTALFRRTSTYLSAKFVPRLVHERLGRHGYDLAEDFAEYGHPPDPFTTLHVSPDDIERFSGRAYPPYHGPDARLGVVRCGAWDRTEPETIDSAYEPRYELYREGATRFDESVFYRSLERRFLDDVPWEDTRWYRRSLEFVEAGRPTSKGITSREGLQQRCESIDGLYRRIRRMGYRSQYNLGNYPAAAHEVSVDIGRDGALLFVNGRNRLALARILEIDRIPVGVYVRHRRWMERRESVATGDPLPGTPVPTDHPDLADLR